MRTVMILKGLPGCGKSTFARELMKKEPERWRRVNRDDLRGMFGTTYNKSNEDFVRNVQDVLIKQALGEGKDVIIDNTHLVPQTVKKLHKLLESVGDVKVIEKAFNVDLPECHRRNQLREGTARVPDKVINDMARAAGIDKGRKLFDKESYYAPRGMSGKAYANDPKLPSVILCDLDGTLAIMGDRSPYDASECDVKDLPNTPVIECVKAMWNTGRKVVFMSGRDSKYREQTIRFIEKHVLVERTHKPSPGGALECEPYMSPINYELHMREAGDMRKDSIIKGELFDAHVAGKYHVLFVLDDRNQVVDFWRSIGLTCFQVGPGDF